MCGLTFDYAPPPPRILSNTDIHDIRFHYRVVLHYSSMSVFPNLLFFFSWPPLSLIYPRDPTPFAGTVTYEKKLLYFHMVDLCIRIYITLFRVLYCFSIQYFI